MATRSLVLLLLFFVALAVAEQSKTSPFEGHKQEKLTHIHFYMHDVISGNKPTGVPVASGPGTNSSATSFGVVVVADDPLTEGPDPSSKQVGRGQGLYASADTTEASFLMAFNFVFTEGEFNGSTLAMHGRNQIWSKGIREMPIIGGTGAFRFAKGYVQAKTNKLVGRDAVVEYDLFISH